MSLTKAKKAGQQISASPTPESVPIVMVWKHYELVSIVE